MLFKHFIQEREVQSSHSKAFIYLKSLKISVKKLIRDVIARCQPASLRKKTLPHILLHVICLHFLRTNHDNFFGRGLESVRAQFLSGNINIKQKGALLVIYLSNYDSSKSTSFMLNVEFEVVLKTVFAK